MKTQCNKIGKRPKKNELKRKKIRRTICMRSFGWSSLSVFLSIAFSSSLYLVSRCIGITIIARIVRRSHCFCDSAHCNTSPWQHLSYGTQIHGTQAHRKILFFILDLLFTYVKFIFMNFLKISCKKETRFLMMHSISSN